MMLLYHPKNSRKNRNQRQLQQYQWLLSFALYPCSAKSQTVEGAQTSAYLENEPPLPILI